LFLFGGLEPVSVYQKGFCKAGFEEVEIVKRFHFDPRNEIENLLNKTCTLEETKKVIDQIDADTFQIVVFKLHKTADWQEAGWQCPKCTQLQPVVFLPTLNKQYNQKLWEKMKQGKLNLHQCISCGHSTRPFPFQCHDMDNRTMGFVFPEVMQSQKEEISEQIQAMYGSKLKNYEIKCFFDHAEFTAWLFNLG
jgi:Zn ribbon nucleic-acid-binding protein